MPSFTSQVPNLVTVGPVVEVIAGPARSLVQALTAKGQPVPTPVKAMAMIDTGASGTVSEDRKRSVVRSRQAKCPD